MFSTRLLKEERNRQLFAFEYILGGRMACPGPMALG